MKIINSPVSVVCKVVVAVVVIMMAISIPSDLYEGFLWGGLGYLKCSLIS